MQLLAPLWLALGAAAAVPLLLHLWNRRRPRTRVPFPAVRYVAAAARAGGAAVRVRRRWLLALRVLAVVALAAAAARPASRGRVGPRAPAAVALVLDNSLSTSAVVGGRTVLDALREEMDAVLAAARPGDRFWLLTADGAVLGGDASAVRRGLAAARPLGGAGDPSRALRHAAALARQALRDGDAGSGGVVLATDGQATTWARPVRLPAVRVAVVRPAQAPPADVGVAALRAAPSRWAPAGVITGRLTAAAPWRLTVRDGDAHTVTEVRGSAAAEDGFGVRVPLRPAARGWLAATLALPADAWGGDDARAVAVYVADPPDARVDASAGPFAAAAVAALASGSPVVPGRSTIVRVGEPQAVASLPAVLVAPADGARVGAANQALARLGVPWRFGPVALGAPGVTLGSPAIDAPPGAAPPARVIRRWTLQPATPASGTCVDTMAAAGGAPWIIAGDRYVLVASPLDTAWTNFPTRASFLPWLADALARAGGAAGIETRPDTAAPGQVIRVPPAADALQPATSGQPPRPVRGARTTAPQASGVYFWLRAGTRIGALVVNPEVEELVLVRLSRSALRERVQVEGGDTQVATVERGSEAAAWVYGGDGRRRWTAPLAALALLLLGAEATAARVRRPAA